MHLPPGTRLWPLGEGRAERRKAKAGIRLRGGSVGSAAGHVGVEGIEEERRRKRRRR